MKRWASLVGWLGAVFLVFGFVSALVELFSSGVLVIDALLAQFAWAAGNFALGLACVIVSLVANAGALRERLGSSEARRASKYGTSAILGALLAIALLGIGAYFASQREKKWDFTEAKLHSLSEQALQVLGGLDGKLAITALYTPLEQRRAAEFLKKFEEAAPDKVSVEIFDPQNKPGRLRELGIGTDQLGAGLVHLKLGSETAQVTELSEEALVNAIVKLTRRGGKKAYYSIGHNERAIEGEAGKEAVGFGNAVEALKSEGYQVEPLLLASQADVPADAQVLIIAGPTRKFLETEHASVLRYVARGGALLALMDPRAQTDLAPTLAKLGVTVGDDVVVDIETLAGSPYAPFAAQYGDHPITRGFRDPALFVAVSSVKPVKEGAGLAPLVTTGERSWAETDFESLAQETARPDPAHESVSFVPIAVVGDAAVTPAEGKQPGRLVVFGDSDFATNQWFDQFRDRDLFLNSVNWLLGEPEAITIRPRKAGASQLALSESTLRTIRTAALFVLPEAIALLGVVAWWRRRRAPGR
ncbi:MAG TPA: GldG family protein [Myxococcota bacterium]